MIQILLSIFFLTLPTWFEVYRDRNGDSHPNSDWKLRGMTCLLSGAVAAIILGKLTLITFLCYSFTSVCIFTAIFPYWINYVHLKNGVTHILFNNRKGAPIPFGLATRKEKFDHIVNHLSDSAWPDKVLWWRQIGWKARMWFHVDILLFGIAVFTICYLHTHG